MGPTDALVPWPSLSGIVRPEFLPTH